MLGLLEDSGASEGHWSYRRILELQEMDAGAAGGYWGYKKKILGLQEEDLGASGEGHWGCRRKTLGYSPATNTKPLTQQTPEGFQGTKEPVWEAMDAPSSPTVRGRPPAHRDVPTPLSGMHPAPQSGLICLCILLLSLP